MGAVAISHLSKDFHTGIRGTQLRAVDDVSLAIADNEIFGLLGPNGCGKSTLLKLLLGLIEPSHGTCAIFGISSRDVRSRSAIGYLPEAPYFYQYLSGVELLIYSAKLCGHPRHKRRARVREVLHWVDLEEAGERKVGTYSKGMLQRLGIAQALVHDPKLLVLDEPTAGVDPLGFEKLGALLLTLKEQGKTILVCSHLLAQMETWCERIGIMHRGKLVVEGAVDVLLQGNAHGYLSLEGVSARGRAEIETLLEIHGGSCVNAAAAQHSLHTLFLRHVGGTAVESKPGNVRC